MGPDSDGFNEAAVWMVGPRVLPLNNLDRLGGRAYRCCLGDETVVEG